MVLSPKPASAHNKMRAKPNNASQTSIKQAFTPLPSPSKKRKLNHTPQKENYGQITSSPRRDRRNQVIPDSDAETGDEELSIHVDSHDHRTDLEQALPPVKTDREAIQEYETMRAADSTSSSDLHQRLGKGDWIRGKSSIYVDAFNLALETVLDEESHLFDEAEKEVFNQWRSLSYEAQYLYVRLFLRKTSAWHRIKRLGYYNDIGDMQKAVDELFKRRDLPQTAHETLISPGEFEPPAGTILKESFTFADSSDEQITSLEDASSLLLLDELKEFAKEAKVQGKNKTELLRSFRRTSGKQKALAFSGSGSIEGAEDTSDEARSESPEKRDDSGSSGNRDAYWVGKIMAETGPCIRLSLAANTLFERVHLVFYRSTEWTEKSLTTIILARIARLNFPEYIVSRSADIFASRALLLEFEASLRTQFRIDNILEFNGTPTKDSLETVLEIFEAVYPRWSVLLAEEQAKEDTIYASGEGAYLRRLSPAWVYTRIIHKAAFVMGAGKFKRHKREHEILSELLEQRLFHASRRGAWYQRKALLEEHYMADLTPDEGRTLDQQKRHWKTVAMQTCEAGLQDNLVHVIHHYDLQKRLTKLEKSVKIAKRFQHDFGHARLRKPTERIIEGIRIEYPPKLARADSGRRISGPAVDGSRRGAKTIWLDDNPEGTGECSVEEMCLSWYRSEGWKGFHSEGGIVRTLFALLFYDVMFTYVPNVFQTPFQACPLDLHTDAFFPTRMSEINQRLADIANGKAESIIRSVWEREHEKKTCVVGLNWTFELEDLVEIAQCMKGERLATLCKVMAQEYAERGGGVPDLFLWSKEKDECCFAEVKSENDRLSDTQRQWIHVLSNAGIRVELALAIATDVQHRTL